MRIAGWASALAVLAYVASFVLFRLTDTTLQPIGGDTTYYFLPTMAFFRDSILRGELPLWNPYQLAGAPFLALHTPAVFYPLVAVFAPLPPHVALIAHVVTHLLLAALLTSLLARHMGLEPAGTLAASFAFIGSYQMVGAVLMNTAYLSTFIWLPATFWAIRRVVRDPRWGNGAIFAVVLGCGFLAGFSQGFLFIIQAGGLYVLYLLACAPSWASRRHAVVVLAGSGVIALGLVSVQLLPTLEHAVGATRNFGGLAMRQVARYGLQDAKIWAGLLGRGVGWFAPPAIFVPLTVVALTTRGFRREAWFFLLLFVVTLDFMRGRHGIVFPLYYKLPLGNVFRLPLRIGFVTEFAAAMLVGLGVSAVISNLSRRPTALALASLLLPLCIATDVFVRNAPHSQFDPLTNPERLYQPSELAAVAATFGYDRMFITGLRIPKKFGQIHRVFAVPDYEPLLPGAYKRFFGIPAGELWHGQLTVGPLESSTRGRHSWLMQNPELLDLMSVRYYVDGRPRALQKRRPLNDIVKGTKIRDGFPAIYERDAAVPRAYIVHDLLRVGSEAEALAAVRGRAFDQHTAAVVQDMDAPLQPLIPHSAEHAHITDYRPRSVTIDASCASTCLLVLTDFFDPNWRAAVNRETASIARVNYLMRGVRLSPGRHRIEFTYEPRSLKTGAVISLGSLVMLAMMTGAVLKGRSIAAQRPTR